MEHIRANYGEQPENIEDEIQGMMDSIVEEYLSGAAQPNSRSNQADRNNQSVEYMSTIHALRDVLTGYNNNNRLYNENMRSFLNTMSSIQQDLENTRRGLPTPVRPPPTRPQSRRSRPLNETRRPQEANHGPRTYGTFGTRQPSSTNMSRSSQAPTTLLRDVSGNNQSTPVFSIVADIPIWMWDISANPILDISGNGPGTRTTPTNEMESAISRLLYAFFPQTMNDVVVRPTNEQITVATEILPFVSSETHNNTSCPITLEEFIDGESVQRIRNCGHIFREGAIADWFSRNVRCPICRYDIRTYVEPEIGEQIQEIDDPVTSTHVESLTNVADATSSMTTLHPLNNVYVEDRENTQVESASTMDTNSFAEYGKIDDDSDENLEFEFATGFSFDDDFERSVEKSDVTNNDTRSLNIAPAPEPIMRTNTNSRQGLDMSNLITRHISNFLEPENILNNILQHASVHVNNFLNDLSGNIDR